MNDPETTPDELRQVVYEWLQEDAPTGIKMMMMPDVCESLIERLEKLCRKNQ